MVASCEKLKNVCRCQPGARHPCKALLLLRRLQRVRSRIAVPGAGGAGAEGDPDFRLRTAVPVGGSKKRILADLPGMAPGRGFLDRVGRGQAKVLFGEGLQFGERADAPGRAAVEVVGPEGEEGEVGQV